MPSSLRATALRSKSLLICAAAKRPVMSAASLSSVAAVIPTTTVPTYNQTSSQIQFQPQQKRWSSHAPMGPASSLQTRKPVTITTLRNMYNKNEPITMLTAHDFPSAFVADDAGMDMVLVGDSLAMVALGMNDTNAVTLDDMVLHCRSVTRAVRSAFVVSLDLIRLLFAFFCSPCFWAFLLSLGKRFDGLAKPGWAI